MSNITEWKMMGCISPLYSHLLMSDHFPFLFAALTTTAHTPPRFFAHGIFTFLLPATLFGSLSDSHFIKLVTVLHFNGAERRDVWNVFASLNGGASGEVFDACTAPHSLGGMMERCAGTQFDKWTFVCTHTLLIPSLCQLSVWELQFDTWGQVWFKNWRCIQWLVEILISYY